MDQPLSHTRPPENVPGSHVRCDGVCHPGGVGREAREALSPGDRDRRRRRLHDDRGRNRDRGEGATPGRCCCRRQRGIRNDPPPPGAASDGPFSRLAARFDRLLGLRQIAGSGGLHRFSGSRRPWRSQRSARIHQTDGGARQGRPRTTGYRCPLRSGRRSVRGAAFPLTTGHRQLRQLGCSDLGLGEVQ